MSVEETIAHFIHQTQGFLASEGITEASLQQIGERLSVLAQEPGLIPEADLAPLHEGTATTTALYSLGPDDLTLFLAMFPSTAPTPIHNHNSWGVACVVTGHDHYKHWEQVDDGSDPAHAQLRLLYERELGAGEFVTWTEPPHDLHSQQGIDGPCWELVLFGKNAMALPRRYFDLQTGSVREVVPQ